MELLKLPAKTANLARKLIKNFLFQAEKGEKFRSESKKGYLYLFQF